MAKTFITSDGYKLQQQPDGTWFDGDVAFPNAVWPVDANNEPLEGSYGPDEPTPEANPWAGIKVGDNVRVNQHSFREDWVSAKVLEIIPQTEGADLAFKVEYPEGQWRSQREQIETVSCKYVKPQVGKLFDVIASVNDLHSAGGDGAYDLIGEGQTIDEILAKLREQLETLHESLAQGGAYSSGFKFVPCYLSMNIGPTGSYENLPMDAAVAVPGMTPAMLRGKKPLTAKAVVQMKSEPEHHTFEEWLKEVDENLVDICCLTHERLPDVDYIGLYKTGNTPAEAADFAVQNMKNS